MKILGFDLGDGESAVTLLDEDSLLEALQYRAQEKLDG